VSYHPPSPTSAITGAMTSLGGDHAAWQIHADDQGSLEVGKRADFALASADPRSSDPASWPDIDIHAT
jgi:predicted amidohydrolase YtcJ